MRIVVTGATGFIGSALVKALLAKGHAVTVISRDGERAKQQLDPSGSAGVVAITGNIEEPGAWTESFAGADSIAHLAGQSVAAKRWDAREKQIVRDSRVESTRVIVEAIAKLRDKPKSFVVSSGTDYYPFAEDPQFDDDEIDESAKPGDSFLARVCRDWENEAFAAKAHGVRVVAMRTGFVVGPGGGLDKMTTPFKFFVGGRIGSGKQWMSWIHRDDAVAIYITAIEDERYAGPINLVYDSVRNRDFANVLGKVMHRPSWLPVPGFAVKAAVGEFAEYVLKGRRVVPQALRALGFEWKHTDLAAALADAVR